MRQFNSNTSYLDGRAIEMFIDNQLTQQGLITISTRGSQMSYDLIVINPVNNKEYLIQIKSSKFLKPYITCKHLSWLIQDAKKMDCEPLLCFCYTISKKFAMFNPLTKDLVFTNSEQLREQIQKFKCYNKEK